jgi:hypothetical protein
MSAELDERAKQKVQTTYRIKSPSLENPIKIDHRNAQLPTEKIELWSRASSITHRFKYFIIHFPLCARNKLKRGGSIRDSNKRRDLCLSVTRHSRRWNEVRAWYAVQ